MSLPRAGFRVARDGAEAGPTVNQPRSALHGPRSSDGAAPVVLNTRPHEQAAELSERLRQAGYTPLEAPAIETVAAWDARELSQIVERLRAKAYAWAVFASRNAVRFFLEGVTAVGGSAADLHRVKLLSGQGTAEALRAAGLEATHTLARFSAEAALDFLDTELAPGERVLAPRALEGRDDLLTGLTTRVDAPICYRTQAVAPSALAERLGNAAEIAAVVVTSPSAVPPLVGCLPPGTTVVCLGDTTAQAARAAGLHVDRVAERTDLPSLVEAVTAALATAAPSAEREPPNATEVPT